MLDILLLKKPGCVLAAIVVGGFGVNKLLEYWQLSIFTCGGGFRLPFSLKPSAGGQGIKEFDLAGFRLVA